MAETKEEMGFFERNEEQVSKTMCKILLWITIVFPVLFLCSALHVFQVTFAELAKISIIGVPITVSPTILRICKVPTKFIKNYSIVALAIVIMLMASNSHIGIYMTYVLTLALSCMYFDRKFTIRTAVIGFVCMLLAVYFRSGNVTLAEGDTRIKWLMGYETGFIIEYIAMSAVFIAIATRARRLLENLHNTEKVQEILDNCGTASGNLSKLLGNLQEAICDTTDNNKRICEEAQKTREGCENNLCQVQETNASIMNMDESMQAIRQRAAEMSEITEDSYAKTENYIQIMQRAVDSMNQIAQSSGTIREKITQVGDCSAEIAAFADTIVAIANQTNILALNASIEAARAGEHGKGFAVVASQVGVLADRCKEATQSITSQIQKMNENVEAAHSSVDENGASVAAGIEEITMAREEAKKLLEAQNASSQKVKEVEEQVDISLSHQEKVAAMAGEMNETTNQSLEQVTIIGQAMEEQTELTEVMQKAFVEVQEISDTLLKISRQ